MRVRVNLAASVESAITAVRQALGGDPDVTLSAQTRDLRRANDLIEQESHVLITDTAMLADAQFSERLAKRRGPSVIIDAGRPPSIDYSRLGISVIPLAQVARKLFPAMQESVRNWSDPAFRNRPGAATTSPEDNPQAPGGATPSASGAGRQTRRPFPEVVLIGSSTGGPTVILDMLKALQRPALPIVIAQHMPEHQAASFAAHLTEVSGFPVGTPRSGAGLQADHALLLPGGCDWGFERSAGGTLRLVQLPEHQSLFHPSADALMRSAAHCGLAAAAIILTGMGADGAAGAAELARQGMPVLTQQADTCSVPGMPVAALKAAPGAIALTPERIVDEINRWGLIASEAAAL